MTTETITVSTDQRLAVIDITGQVTQVIPEDADGTVTIFSEHTTTGVTINESEGRLLNDFETALSELISDTGWAHDEIDDNADSHVRSMLLGPSETVPVSNGDLQLGTWQSILLIECDGPRSRTIQIATLSV
ncbi:secondary thiamine-phosphate synthase enzyme YjbQ [Halodesulfurarchaeum sp.]|uniref:secondary thiamine-phosphate synthase enzyme YjbQ n=1 Tax=Halodesulfurarchaeum sp. TaxID=1980530 RepID=UPI002FC3A39E